MTRPTPDERPRRGLLQRRLTARLRHLVGDTADLTGLLGLMALFFLVVCVVGILKPIRNVLALDGLGATAFYQVYLVSALVVLFVPIFNKLAGHIPWRMLFSAVALFFAVNLVLFRIAYVPGSAFYGLLFYGWYDLFAAALVTQFFMATQFYVDARSAKGAYPLVIAGGSIGATLGGAITGFFAQSFGTPNLLLVAAALIFVFAFAIPRVLPATSARPAPRSRPAVAGTASRSDLRRLAADRHVRLIAAAVLVTILVKQLVDYQYNAITKVVFDAPDAIAEFQGKFNAATQWLPLVALAALRPALRRWGVATAILVLPVAMLGSAASLVIAFGLWTAAIAKGTETTLRYSVERAGREFLYVPLPDEIKLKAKAYIDVAVEKGVGKVGSALLIMALLALAGPRSIPFFTAALAALWFGLALKLRREYVRTLSRAIEGRFASVRGIFASLVDKSTLPAVRRALVDPSPLRAAFALELLDQVPDREVASVTAELHGLTQHERPELRAGAWTQLARAASTVDATLARRALDDEAPAVREAAARALLRTADGAAPALLNELLHHPSTHVRSAVLASVLGQNAPPALRAAGVAYIDARTSAPQATTEARVELALAAGGLRADEADELLQPFLDDQDARVRSAALRSAGALGRVVHCERMIHALADRGTRDAARDALVLLGEPAVQPLARTLLDTHAAPQLRRAVPRVLAEIPTQSTIDAMLRLVLAPETDQLLDFRTLRALGRLRARHAQLTFNVDLVHEVAERECDAACAYDAVRRGLPNVNGQRDVAALLRDALEHGWRQRREGVFRCLGLLYSAADVRRAHDAVAGGTQTLRANALEWVEEMIGTARFNRLRPVLEPQGVPVPPATPDTLVADGDPWIARLARAVTNASESDMELIEKVFLLQQVDLLRGARSAHVALLASVAEEIDVDEGAVLIEAGSLTGALYVVTHGTVELTGVGERLQLGPEEAFGAWGLIDEQPSPIEARSREAARLLRVARADFHDLLADHPELALGMMQGVARRMRSLVA